MTNPATPSGLPPGLTARAIGVAGLALCFAMGLGATLSGGQAEARTVGIVAAVQSRLDGAPPGEAPAPKVLGGDVVLDERLTSSDTGGGQILFEDQTSLTVAPGSEIVIDRFVYDPDAGSGEIGLSLAKGAMRFIGGRITKQADAVVTTPTASLAIRGGIALVDTRGGVLRVTHIAGERTEITLPNGETLSLSREGAVAEVRPVEGGGFEIVYLGVATPEEIQATYTAIEGGKGDEAFELDGEGETAIAFDEPGGLFRGPVSTSGAEPQGGLALEPEILIQQVELDVAETEILEDTSMTMGGGEDDIVEDEEEFDEECEGLC